MLFFPYGTTLICSPYVMTSTVWTSKVLWDHDLTFALLQFYVLHCCWYAGSYNEKMFLAKWRWDCKYKETDNSSLLYTIYCYLWSFMMLFSCHFILQVFFLWTSHDSLRFYTTGRHTYETLSIILYTRKVKELSKHLGCTKQRKRHRGFLKSFDCC